MEKQNKNNKMHSLGLCLAISMMTLLNFASRMLDLNIEEVNIVGTAMTFSEFKSLCGIILGTLVVLFSFLFSVPAHILTRKIIKQKHPREIFQNSFYPMFLFMTFAQFFISSLVGSIIIPSVIFFEYLPHDALTYISLLLFIAFEIVAFCLFLTFQYYAIVLTDVQIIGISFCSSIKAEQIFLKDIKTIEPVWYGYEVIAKNGNILTLKMRPFATKVCKRLKELLNMEKSAS